MSLQCFSECFFQEGFLFLKEKKNSFGLRKGVSHQGVKEGPKETKKKNSIFFHYTCPSAVNSLHICTCSARALVHGITGDHRPVTYLVKDQKLKLRNLHVSYTLGSSGDWNTL
jgi:hypothetical protein